MFERTDPQTLLMWLIVAGLLYLLIPYDVLPDFLGLPGRIDDMVVIGWLAWFYRNHARQFMAGPGGEKTSAGGSASSSQSGSSTGTKRGETLDAYQVLGVSRSASSDEIQAAYRARMREYHPDKVAHLGEALQKLAHEKSQEIQQAYQSLRR